MNEKIERIALDLLDLGLDDWVPFGSLLWEVQQKTVPGLQQEQLIRDVLQHVLSNGLMVAGDLSEKGHEPWNGTVDDSVDRILEHYKKVSLMGAGYICWFANTPEGDRLASARR